ncbi:uncharacterized protein LOC135683210 isoform X1 [Rhopilema esculentum]|uniref:uncharacterized protein LOC135683210 isoform X1 n=1 Tax=Rhopilema esculentum TaxID=499914 RepID=UPI0031DAE5C8
MINLRALLVGIPFRTRSGRRRSVSCATATATAPVVNRAGCSRQTSVATYGTHAAARFLVLRLLLAVPVLHWHQNRWHANTNKRSDSLTFWFNKSKIVSSNNYDPDVILDCGEKD